MGRNKQVSDEALLAAARAVFIEQGFGASTREVARRAGVSEAVIYQRHATKLDLFMAAMIPPPLELVEKSRRRGQVRAGEPGSGEGLAEELCGLASATMKYFREAMPVLLQLVTHPSFDLAELADLDDRIPLRRLGEAISGCLERHRAAGSIGSDPERIQAATLTLVSSLHSLALFERMGVHGGSFPPAAVRNIVRLIVAGLQAERGERA